MTPPRDQPPLFDVVMGDAVPTFHRDGDDQREAHARAMAARRRTAQAALDAGEPWAAASLAQLDDER
jgi:hypothetical protein